jgi:hypothetical protein
VGLLAVSYTIKLENKEREFRRLISKARYSTLSTNKSTMDHPHPPFLPPLACTPSFAPTTAKAAQELHSTNFHVTLILEVKSNSVVAISQPFTNYMLLNRREQRNIHFQYILLKFKVPWQPSPLEF